MKTFTSLLCFVLAGCMGGGLVPTQRTETGSIQTAEKISSSQSMAVKKIVEGSPRPNVTVSVTGTNNAVAVPSEWWGAGVKSSELPAMPYREETTVSSELGQKTSVKEQTEWLNKQSIPWGVCIILFAVGILLLLRALKAARAVSPAFNAAISLGDSALASAMDSLHNLAAREIDPIRQASILAAVAQAEKARGKLNAQEPPKA